MVDASATEQGGAVFTTLDGRRSPPRSAPPLSSIPSSTRWIPAEAAGTARSRRGGRYPRHGGGRSRWDAATLRWTRQKKRSHLLALRNRLTLAGYLNRADAESPATDGSPDRDQTRLRSGSRM